MKTIKVLFFLFSIFILSGCLPEFKNPLTDVGEQKLDGRLAGRWVKIGEEKNGIKRPDIYYNFALSENKQYYVVSSWKTNEGVRKNSKGLMHIHTSELKGQRYMNVKPHDPTGKEKAKDYLILKYTIEGDKMGFAISNIGPFREAVLNGKLKGDVPMRKLSDGTTAPSKYQVKVTASQRKLQKYFSINDKKIFVGKLAYIERFK